MQGQQGDHGLLDYSRLQLGHLGMEALDPLEFDRYRRMIRENRHRGDEALLDLDNLELARALGAVERSNGATEVRVLGLLLFGHADALSAVLPAHEVAFQVLSGMDVEVNDFFRWPLLRVVEELETRFRARTYEGEMQMGMRRVGVPNYALRALREGVANALIHRDYTRLGAVYVQWREDRVDIFNPGGFPQGVRLDNLLVTEPRPRNPLLADAFKRAGIVERTARGIDTIFYEQLRYGRAMPSYARSTTTSVALTLPGGEPNLGFVRLVADAGPLPCHWTNCCFCMPSSANVVWRLRARLMRSRKRRMTRRLFCTNCAIGVLSRCAGLRDARRFSCRKLPACVSATQPMNAKATLTLSRLSSWYGNTRKCMVRSRAKTSRISAPWNSRKRTDC